MPQKYAIQWGSIWHKSRLKSRDFYRKYGIQTQLLWHTNPPLLCHMHRFYWGWGWSLICWKKTPQKTGHSKNPKKAKCRKTDKKNQLAQLCSQIVFLNFLGWHNFSFFGWKHYKNSGFSIFSNRSKYPKISRNVESKLGPSMLRNKIGPSFDSKNGVFWAFFFGSFFFKSSFSLQKEEDFEKQKKKKNRKIGPSFDSKKGYFWIKFWLYSIYMSLSLNIYIYIYISVCL